MITSTINDVCHGWYSQRAVNAGCGTAIYLDADGAEHEITVVSTTADVGESYKWEDSVYLGVVGKFLRVGRPREFLTGFR
jgi:hypothetical protein